MTRIRVRLQPDITAITKIGIIRRATPARAMASAIVVVISVVSGFSRTVAAQTVEGELDPRVVKLVGSVSEGVLLQKVLAGSAGGDTRLEYLIEKSLPTVPMASPLSRAMKLLAESNAAVAVDDAGAPAGLLTRFDLLEYIAP